MDNQQKSVAYIIGNAYETMSQLPGVYTINQFFSAMLENNLPEHSAWMIGQGIPTSVYDILTLCKKYRSDVYFHGAEETVLPEKNQASLLYHPVLTDSVLSKLSQMIRTIAYRFGFCR